MCLGGGLKAQSEPTGRDLERLKTELAALRAERDASRAKALNSSLTQLAAATQSPAAAVAAYSEAIRIVEFAGRSDAGAAFTDWKRANSDQLQTEAMQRALVMHLRYLGLTLDRAANADEPMNYAAVMAYVKDLAVAKQETDRPDAGRMDEHQARALTDRVRELLDKPLTDSPFVKAYQLEALFPGLKDWEMSPGNLEGILNQNVRAGLRAENDPRLVETWDLQIEIERSLADEKGPQLAATNFQNVRIPRLMWSRAEDTFVLGNKAVAYEEMLGLLKGYPGHPDAAQWLERLTALVGSEQPAEPAAVPPTPEAPEDMPPAPEVGN